MNFCRNSPIQHSNKTGFVTEEFYHNIAIKQGSMPKLYIINYAQNFAQNALLMFSIFMIMAVLCSNINNIAMNTFTVQLE